MLCTFEQTENNNGNQQGYFGKYCTINSYGPYRYNAFSLI